MNQRTQRFTNGQKVTDLYGTVFVIIETFLDPHPAGYEHCGGLSARYLVQRSDWLREIRWDWQLSTK